jgi:hypothetical protein
MLLLGDLIFSQPTHVLAQELAGTTVRNDKDRRRKVYRYTMCLSNPFPGSSLSHVPDHHFVEILFQFMTLIPRYPRRRNDFLALIAIDTARKWNHFANGLAPWEGEYDRTNEGKVALCDGIRG